MPVGQGGVELIIKGGEDFEALSRRLKGNKKVKAELTRAMRAAAKPTIEAIRRRILEIPSKSEGPTRSQIARGVKVRQSSSSRSAGVRIRVDSSSVDPAHAAMTRALNKSSWRHPVFGDTTTWVTQPGYEYFEKEAKEHAAEFRRELTLAMERIRNYIE